MQSEQGETGEKIKTQNNHKKASTTKENRWKH